MLKPRALLFAFIGMITIGGVVFYYSVPEKQPPDPRFSIRFSSEKAEWHNGDDVLQLQNAVPDEIDGYFGATLQKKLLVSSENGERMTLWLYLRSLQYVGDNGYDFEIVEYQFLLRYPDKTMIEYVNAVIFYNEEGDVLFETPIILGKINFKLQVSRYMRSNVREELFPITTVYLFFTPEPQQVWTVRRSWTYEWHSEMEKTPLLVQFSDDGSASVPNNFSMEMFERDNL